MSDANRRTLNKRMTFSHIQWARCIHSIAKFKMASSFRIIQQQTVVEWREWKYFWNQQAKKNLWKFIRRKNYAEGIFLVVVCFLSENGFPAHAKSLWKKKLNKNSVLHFRTYYVHDRLIKNYASLAVRCVFPIGTNNSIVRFEWGTKEFGKRTRTVALKIRFERIAFSRQQNEYLTS